MCVHTACNHNFPILTHSNFIFPAVNNTAAPMEQPVEPIQVVNADSVPAAYETPRGEDSADTKRTSVLTDHRSFIDKISSFFNQPTLSDVKIKVSMLCLFALVLQAWLVIKTSGVKFIKNEDTCTI